MSVETLAFLGGSAKWLYFALLAVLILAVGWVAMRWESSELMASLRGVRMFGDLPRRQLRSLARVAHRVDVPPGQAVTQEGEEGQSLYVIEEGTAAVLAGGERKATLSAPAYVGEIAVIDGGPRTATITAETPIRAVEVSPRSLSFLLESNPGFRRAVFLRLQEIVRSAGGSVSEEPSAVDRAALMELCAQLRRVQTPDWVQREPGRRRRNVLARRR